MGLWFTLVEWARGVSGSFFVKWTAVDFTQTEVANTTDGSGGFRRVQGLRPTGEAFFVQRLSRGRMKGRYQFFDATSTYSSPPSASSRPVR